MPDVVLQTCIAQLPKQGLLFLYVVLCTIAPSFNPPLLLPGVSLCRSLLGVRYPSTKQRLTDQDRTAQATTLKARIAGKLRIGDIGVLLCVHTRRYKHT